MLYDFVFCKNILTHDVVNMRCIYVKFALFQKSITFLFSLSHYHHQFSLLFSLVVFIFPTLSSLRPLLGAIIFRCLRAPTNQTLQLRPRVYRSILSITAYLQRNESVENHCSSSVVVRNENKSLFSYFEIERSFINLNFLRSSLTALY
jgi:hypothetical protein